MTRDKNSEKFALIAAICYVCYSVYELYYLWNGLLNIWPIFLLAALVSMSVFLFQKNQKGVFVANCIYVIFGIFKTIQAKAIFTEGGFLSSLKFSLSTGIWKSFFIEVGVLDLWVIPASIAMLVITCLTMVKNKTVKYIWFLPGVILLCGRTIFWNLYGAFSILSFYWDVILFSLVEVAGLIFAGLWMKEQIQIVGTTLNKTTSIGGADELKMYKELLDSGVITQEEFEAKKKQIL